MALRARRGTWHYRFQVDGREYSGCTDLADTSRNKTAALRREMKARESVLSGRAQELRLQVKPFSDASAAFLTWASGHYVAHPSSSRRLRVSFASLGVFFGVKPVSTILAGDVEDFKAWRRRSGVREVTLRHDLHALSKAFGYWLKHNWARVNVVRSVEIPSDLGAVRQFVLGPEEELLYFDAARGLSRSLYDLGRLMVNQGCRPEELLALRCDDVDLVDGYLHIRAGKSQAARRSLLLAPESRAILAQRAGMGGRWIFAGKVPGTRLSRVTRPHLRVLDLLAVCECGLRSIDHSGRGACGSFREVSRLSFVIYDLRHTFATRAAAGGMRLSVLARILGHANLRSVMRYVHEEQRSMDAAMERSGFGENGLEMVGPRRA